MPERTYNTSNYSRLVKQSESGSGRSNSRACQEYEGRSVLGPIYGPRVRLTMVVFHAFEAFWLSPTPQSKDTYPTATKHEGKIEEASRA